MEPKNQKISQVLKSALASFDEGKRWIKGSFIGRRGGQTVFCAMGAVQHVTKDGDKRHKAFAFLDSAIRAEKDSQAKNEARGIGGGISIPSFNDHGTTRFTDIQRIFKRAIECAKAHEKVRKAA